MNKQIHTKIEAKITSRDIPEHYREVILDAIFIYLEDLSYDQRTCLWSYDKTMPTSNKCLSCKKYYKFPNSVFAPRNLICASCEDDVLRETRIMSLFDKKRIDQYSKLLTWL